MRLFCASCDVCPLLVLPLSARCTRVSAFVRLSACRATSRRECSSWQSKYADSTAQHCIRHGVGAREWRIAQHPSTERGEVESHRSLQRTNSDCSSSTAPCAVVCCAALCRCAVCQLELQSASRRSSLLEQPSSLASGSSPATFASFPADGHASYVVSEPLVEPGLHCLVCSLAYRDPANLSTAAAPLTYQKYFKFNVLSALSVSSAVHARDEWLLAEVALTNATTRPLLVTSVHIDTRSELDTAADSNTTQTEEGVDKSSPQQSAHFSVQRIGAAPSLSAALSPLSPPVDALLAPSSSRVYLFRIEQLSADSRRVLDLGRVSVEWRQHMGELCQWAAACAVHRLAKANSSQMAAAVAQSNSSGASTPASATAAPLSFPTLPPTPSAARPSDVSLRVLSCPSTAVLERPFSVRLSLHNPLATPLHRCQLLLQRDKMGSVLPVGRSRLYLSEDTSETSAPVGTVQPRSSHTFDLTLAGIGLGVHKIGGIRLVAQSNAAPAMQLDFDSLQQIEIVAHD